MRKSNNDSGLIAKRSNRLLAAGLTALAICFASCKTSSQAPLDDAYYWLEKSAQTSQSIQNTQNSQSTQDIPNFEVLQQQDTVVTIRIKK